MSNVTNIDFERLKSRARSKGIKLEYLNASVSKYRGFLSCVKSGSDRIDENELAIIADKLHTTTDYLTGQTDDPEIPTEEKSTPLSMEKAALINLVRSLPEEDVRRISDYVDFILSRRDS